MDPKQFLDKFKTMTSALTPTQRITLAATFVVVTGAIAASTYWMQSTNYRLLLADMDPEAASQVITRLRDQNIQYVLDEGGRSIRVPADRVDELRLEFAAGGLPASGRIGFEIFDQTSFGATEFLEQVNYRRALEGEIARTIATLSEVASARVHITMAKNSLFGSQAQPAKASVVLKLRRQRPLANATVVAVASLVSASVEGLQPDAVVILDSFGRPLARPVENGDEPADAVQMDRQQRIERDLTERLTGLLEPLAGAGRVRVNVSANLTRQSEEETEERWDPNSAVIRSRQTSGATDALSPGGGRVAGARANLPPGAPPVTGTAPPIAAPPAMAAAVPAGRSGETTNYEISKTVRHSVKPRGDIRRLSVAVVLDDERSVKTTSDGQIQRTSKPRDAAEIQRIHGLVMAAAGIDTSRGDRLTVENIAFDEPEVEEPAPPSLLPTWVEVPDRLPWFALGAVAALAALLFAVRGLARGVVRHVPQLRWRRAAELPSSPDLPRTVDELDFEIDAQLAAVSTARLASTRRSTVIAKRLGAIAHEDPGHAARLLRTWLGDESR